MVALISIHYEEIFPGMKGVSSDGLIFDRNLSKLVRNEPSVHYFIYQPIAGWLIDGKDEYIYSLFLPYRLVQMLQSMESVALMELNSR